MSGNGNLNGRARILAVRAKNVKCIRAVEIDDIGDILEIRGDSGQGKTAILRSIEGALRGLDPSMVRNGENAAEIELRLTNSTINRVIPADGSADTLMVTDAEGRPIAKAKDFLRALYDDAAFNPVAWVRLGGGDGKGKTERKRLQRDQLLQAIPMQLTESDVRAAASELGDAYAAALHGVALTGVDYRQHAFIVCRTLHDACYDHRKGLNALADDADGALAHTPRPTRKAPEKLLAECKSDETAAVMVYHTAKAGAAGRQGLISRRDGLLAKVASTRSSLPARDVVSGAIARHEQAFHETEAEIARLEAQLAAAREKLAETRTLLDECRGQERAWRAHDNDVAELAEAKAELDKGAPVGDLAALEQAMDNARANTEARRLQDLHDAAAARARDARAKSDLFDGLVSLFRDRLPKRLVAKADLPVDGLTIDENEILVNGVPLDNLGSSEQIRVGVMIANVRNPYAGWLPVDGAESLGRADRLALRNAAAEIGLQLIMTFVDADAVPGPGVTVMVAGEAAKAEERKV
jgi:hypothetical protein